MVNLSNALLAFAATLPVAQVAAHPGHDITAELEARKAYMDTLESPGLAHCAAKLKRSGHEARTLARRQAMLEKIRKERGLSTTHHLKARDFPTVLATSHKSENASITAETPNWVLFGDSAAVLSPETDVGPYYVLGESVRGDVRDGQAGIPLTIDIQVIDSTACAPLKDVAIDFWHCNATGVYGGVQGMGNVAEEDTAVLQSKMLRGIQFSDADGVAKFDSIVPGHYMGRTHHIHLLTHINSTILPNNTITGGGVAHVGQIYFDQDLVDAVEATAPYSTNQQTWTKNANDMLMNVGAQNGSDPVVEYVMLGDKIEDGVFAWINFAIDPTFTTVANAASVCSESGCIANPNRPAGPPGGFPGMPGGGMPPFGIPSGFPGGFPGARPSGVPGGVEGGVGFGGFGQSSTPAAPTGTVAAANPN